MAEPVLLICAAYVVLDGLTIVLCGALKGCGRQMLQVEMVGEFRCNKGVDMGQKPIERGNFIQTNWDFMQKNIIWVIEVDKTPVPVDDCWGLCSSLHLLRSVISHELGILEIGDLSDLANRNRGCLMGWSPSDDVFEVKM